MTSVQKRNWVKISRGFYSGPEETDAKRIFIFSVDDGCAWNPCGWETPQPNEDAKTMTGKNAIKLGWVWAHSGMTTYIDQLVADGNLVILHSKIESPKATQKVQKAIDEMLSEVKEPNKIGAFTGLSVEQIKTVLGNKDCVVIPEEIEIDKIGIDPFASTGVFAKAPQQMVIIMMGQPGGGKTTIANKLVEKYGFIYISERRSGYIRNRNIKSLSTELSEMKSSGKSLVIDATHPTRNMRQVYVDYIKQVWPELPVQIGWVTRPGFRLNKLRKDSKPEIALRIYRNTFEAPESDENWFRIL